MSYFISASKRIKNSQTFFKRLTQKESMLKILSLGSPWIVSFYICLNMWSTNEVGTCSQYLSHFILGWGKHRRYSWVSIGDVRQTDSSEDPILNPMIDIRFIFSYQKTLLKKLILQQLMFHDLKRNGVNEQLVATKWKTYRNITLKKYDKKILYHLGWESRSAKLLTYKILIIYHLLIKSWINT